MALLLCLAGPALRAVEVHHCKALETDRMLNGQDGWRVVPGFGQMELVPADGEANTPLAFKNLTDNDTAFHTVPGVRNKPPGLNRLPAAARPARWSAMWLHLMSNGNNIPTADNFIPNLKGIRIIELAPAGDDWVLRWRGGLGPYQVQRRACLTAGDWENVGDPTPLLSAPESLPGTTGLLRIAQP